VRRVVVENILKCNVNAIFFAVWNQTAEINQIVFCQIDACRRQDAVYDDAFRAQPRCQLDGTDKRQIGRLRQIHFTSKVEGKGRVRLIADDPVLLRGVEHLLRKLRVVASAQALLDLREIKGKIKAVEAGAADLAEIFGDTVELRCAAGVDGKSHGIILREFS